MKITTKTGKEVFLSRDNFSCPEMGVSGKYIPNIKSERGTRGLQTNVRVNGQPLFLSVLETPELTAFLENVAAEKKREEYEEEERRKHTVRLVLGVCFYKDYGVHEISFDDRMPEEKIISQILEKGKKELSCCHREESHEKSIMGAYRAWEEKIAKKKRKADEWERKKEDAHRKAKESGEKVLLSSYIVDCTDPEEECSTDTIMVWITPEGKIIEKREHCW